MQLHVNNIDQVTIVDIDGEIDWNTSQDIQAQVGAQIHEGAKILLDLSGVEFMSSAGFRMLLSMYREIEAQHGRLALVKLSEQIKDLMAITGFLKYFPTLPSVEDGVRALQQENSKESPGV
ncbi:anti-sigma factor antagonist [Candidatus Vecturithrix granuli]|uniref:Anti-sigma factor antagonist n=1 Tax=Vecturithrix granuli TaxID=1499967 RepID=A0A081BY88_VECG1|nr:anti-sigma factor antagonist [Candidatus Vecturithrix granuli]